RTRGKNGERKTGLYYLEAKNERKKRLKRRREVESWAEPGLQRVRVFSLAKTQKKKKRATFRIPIFVAETSIQGFRLANVVCVSLSPLFMGHSDFLNLLFAIGVWCTAYITVAILASLRIFNSICSF
ncbi:hypothetical protein QQP08_000024, partial [Theobroma cacao]